MSDTILFRSNRVQEGNRDIFHVISFRRVLEQNLSKARVVTFEITQFDKHSVFDFLSCSNTANSRSKFGTCLAVSVLQLTTFLYHPGSKIVVWNIGRKSANIHKSCRSAHHQVLTRICRSKICTSAPLVIIDVFTRESTQDADTTRDDYRVWFLSLSISLLVWTNQPADKCRTGKTFSERRRTLHIIMRTRLFIDIIQEGKVFKIKIKFLVWCFQCFNLTANEFQKRFHVACAQRT